MTSKSPSELQKSEKYYFQDGDTYFMVGETLYRLHSTILARRLEVFQLLDTPKDSNKPIFVDGGDEKHPIYPPQVSRKEWEYLLELIYDNLEPPPYSLEFLVAILKLSSQWGMPSGRRWAVVHLNQLRTEWRNRTSVPDALLLKLGRQYDVPEWVFPAFLSLVQSPLRYLKPAHRDWLGFHVYEVLARTREALDGERKLIALYPPDVTKDAADSCPNHSQCCRVWKSVWVQEIGMRLLHPQWAMSIDEIAGTLKQLPFVGMYTKCRERAVAVVSNSEALEIERKLVRMAVAKLEDGGVPIERSDVVLPQEIIIEPDVAE